VAAKGPEATLVTDPWQEPGQRVITGVPEGTALVDPVDDQISICQLVEADHRHVTHPKATQRPLLPDSSGLR
jgi:hypothetical protein